MTKYRIVQVLPTGYKWPFVIQYLVSGDSWKEISHGIYMSKYDTFLEAEQAVLKILELDKWNATHGKYQVLKEYE